MMIRTLWTASLNPILCSVSLNCPASHQNEKLHLEQRWSPCQNIVLIEHLPLFTLKSQMDAQLFLCHYFSCGINGFSAESSWRCCSATNSNIQSEKQRKSSQTVCLQPHITKSAALGSESGIVMDSWDDALNFTVNLSSEPQLKQRVENLPCHHEPCCYHELSVCGC